MKPWRWFLLRSWLLAATFAMAADPTNLATLLARPDDADKSPSLTVEDSIFVLSSGDKIRMQWWGTGSGDVTMAVDTRGRLVVPEIGEVRASGLSMAQVRDTLETLIKARYRPRLISTRLVEIQPATVWLAGVMPNPGPQQIPPGTRLSKVLALGGISVPELLRVSTTLPSPRREDGMAMPSLRRVIVVRRDNDTIIADLARAYRSGRQQLDPPLFAGDRVITVLEDRYCGLNTGMQGAGMVEFHPGDTVRSFLEAAGVMRMPAAVKLIDVAGGERMVSLDQTLDSTTVLLSIDRTVEIDRRRVVFISGRVSRPGAYYLTNGMTIRQLVERAGGVVGGPDSGIVVGVRRGGVAVLPGRRPGLDALTPVSEVAKAYQAYLGTFRALYAHGDLPLESEDSVIVKSTQHVVWVGGRVTHPGFVPWIKGRSWTGYIEDAGGFTSDAWESKTQMINPVTEQPGSPEGEVLPGSALIVPEERYIPPEQWIAISISVVSLLSSLVTIFLLLSSS